MFYALRRSGSTRWAAFAGLEPILADDFAVAQHVRTTRLSASSRRPCATPSARRSQRPRHYLSLLQRWFIFPRTSPPPSPPLAEQALLYGLALAPTLLAPLLLVGTLVWPSPLLGTVLAALLRLSYPIFPHLDRAYLMPSHPQPLGLSFR